MMTQDVIDRAKQRKKHCEWPSCIAQKEIANQSVQFWVNSIITGKHLLQLKNTLFFKDGNHIPRFFTTHASLPGT